MNGNTIKVLAVTLAVAIVAPQVADAQGLLARIFGTATDEENLRATIWVDPDGCEHWTIDDGIEGYMSQHLDKMGKPVCRAVAPLGDACMTFDGAALFATNSANVRQNAKSEIEAYFSSLPGGTIIVAGHTDNVGPDAYNLNLSLRRAEAVAKIAKSMGVNAVARGLGEAQPIADNATDAGRAKNRRVDLHCS